MSKTICKICDKEFPQLSNLSRHIKTHKINIKDYYDLYIKHDSNEGLCLICNSPTKFRSITFGYPKHCSVKCSINNPVVKSQQVKSFQQTIKDNPEIIENRIKTYKQTLADNPELLINKNKKLSDTLQSNPDIMKDIQLKRLKTYENNPEIQLRAVEKYKSWCKNNPVLVKEKTEKIKQTMKDNPEIQRIATNKRSISLRNYYKKLYENSGTEPHYLYIMEHQSKPIIKIGLCHINNLRKRTSDICNDFGESKPVFLLESSYDKIDALESYLHSHFNDHCKVQPSGGGKTEWFDECILEEAKQLIQTTQPHIKL